MNSSLTRKKTKSGKSGFFLTLEGTDGVGKSTLFKRLSSHLTKLGYTVCQSREPGGTPLGEKLRTLISHQDMNHWSEVFLLEASRRENTLHRILPALNRKEVMICDRYADSTLAYQGAGRGLPWKKLNDLNRIATQNLSPDITIFLDLDPKKSLGRAKNKNRMEKAGIDFQKNARKGFLRAIKENPNRFLRIDVSKFSANEVCEVALKEILKRITRYSVKKRKT